MPFQPAIVIPCLLIISLVGIASAWAARLSIGTQMQTACQRLFFASMALVGATTLCGLWMGPGVFMATGTSLAVMSLVAVCDFSAADRFQA